MASLNGREELTPTTIGRGAAVSHARLGGANNHVAVVLARRKINREFLKSFQRFE